MRRVRLDYPRLTCDRCGASRALTLPVSADTLLEQVRKWMREHADCREVAGG